MVYPLLSVRVKGVRPEANRLQPRRKTDSPALSNYSLGAEQERLTLV